MVEKKKVKIIFEKSINCPTNHQRISNKALSKKEISEIIPLNLIEPIPKIESKADSFPIIPEISEIDLVRHFISLSLRNYGVDSGFYPLGSCTMKYNPKICEFTASLDGFADIHPLQPECQGALELLYNLEQKLCEIEGMDVFTLQPAAGAHGEYTGIAIIKKYFELKGEKRKYIIIPDSAHGTNPATAAMCGFATIEIESDKNGEVSLEKLEAAMKLGDVAGLMLTNPNTLGLFDRNILKITEIVHKYGGLCYYDGANMNAMMGKCKPGEMGFDIIHVNLHKTFATPHGGGGPGSGPVGVKSFLADYLPNPKIIKFNDTFCFDDVSKNSIGKVKSFYGNFSILVRAYTYILMMGENGLRRASENAVLNANYLRVKLKEKFNSPIDRICQHECVLNDKNLPYDISTMDIAKRLLDYGFHAPTIYFPLIIHGAMMFEPTETESKANLDEFIDVMYKIYEEITENPEVVRKSPINTVVGRLNDVLAARKPILRYQKE